MNENKKIGERIREKRELHGYNQQWVIDELKREGIEISKPKPEEKIDIALYHLKKAVEYYGEDVAIPKMRKHISWYLKGLKNSTYVKDEINKLKKKNKVGKILIKYKKTL